MTYREKILEVFPNANFETYFEGILPSVCPYDLGMIKECGIGMGIDFCEECWEMEMEDDNDD